MILSLFSLNSEITSAVSKSTIAKLLLAHKSVLLKCAFRYCLGLLVAFPKHLGKTTFREKKDGLLFISDSAAFRIEGTGIFFRNDTSNT